MVPAAPRLAALTRLRFGLIAWVVLYHLDLTLGVSAGFPAAAPLLRAGYLGVDGFFLLSGFALWLGYAHRPPRGGQAIVAFLVRRMSKIWPLHVVALLGMAVVVGLAVAAGVTIRDPQRFSAEGFVLQLLLLNAWETMDQHVWNYPSWALSAEWAGYLAFPWVLRGVLGVPRAAVPVLAAAALLGLGALAASVPPVGLNHTLHLGLLRFGLEFTLGLALGRLAGEGRLPPRPVTLALAGLGLTAGLALDLDAVVVAGLAALIAGLWQGGATAAPAARPGLLERLGEASFGVYLCWVFIEAALVGVLRVTAPDLGARVGLLVLGFLACLGAGWLAWRLVELPAQRLILARWAGREARAAARLA